MQNYICLKYSATINYELYSILHRKKSETQLSKLSIASVPSGQTGPPPRGISLQTRNLSDNVMSFFNG